MGLDTTHDCWHGPYSSFNRFREEISKAAGYGELSQYLGFDGLKDWPKSDPIEILLHHSDCDGEIQWQDCGPIADSLEMLLPSLSANDSPVPSCTTRGKAKQFVKGLRTAFKAKENVEFR